MDRDDRDVEHEALLELARRAETAARGHDHEAVLMTTRRLLTALAMHLDNERDERRVLEDAVRESRSRSEQELVEKFVDLVRAAAVPAPAGCGCERLSRTAMRRLRHQIRVEERSRPSRSAMSAWSTVPGERP